MNIRTSLQNSFNESLYQNSDEYDSLKVKIHPIFLHFNNTVYEIAFNDSYSHWVSARARIGCLFMMVMIIIDLIAGAFNENYNNILVFARIAMFSLCAIAIILSYTSLFYRQHQIVLSILAVMSSSVQSYFLINFQYDNLVAYFGAIFLPLLACCILGLKFFTSIFAMLGMLVIFSLFIIFDETKSSHFFTHNQVFIVYIVMAGSINYLLEHSMRREFIYQQVLALEKIRYAELAQNDALTGLANRLGLVSKLNKLVAVNSNQSVGLLIFIDLNGFKPINDHYGHLVGDEVLKIIAQRLSQASYNDNDIICRLGGDEFVVFLDRVNSAKEIDHWITHLNAIIAAPIQLNESFANTKLSVSASIGHSVLDENSQSVDQLLEQADKRMYENKRASKRAIMA